MLPNWIRRFVSDRPVQWEDGMVQFSEGGYAARIESRPQFSSNVYYDYRSFRRILEEQCGDRRFDRGLEVGCGYGRLTPFFGLHVDEMNGVDPDRNALATARRHYPDITFQHGTAQDVPFPDDAFDFLVTWTVLHHVPPEESLDAVGDELRRVLSDDGVLVCCEKVRGTDGQFNWQRSREEYEAIFSPLSLRGRIERLLEPPQLEEIGRPVEDVMLFARS